MSRLDGAGESLFCRKFNRNSICTTFDRIGTPAASETATEVPVGVEIALSDTNDDLKCRGSIIECHASQCRFVTGIVGVHLPDNGNGRAGDCYLGGVCFPASLDKMLFERYPRHLFRG